MQSKMAILNFHSQFLRPKINLIIRKTILVLEHSVRTKNFSNNIFSFIDVHEFSFSFLLVLKAASPLVIVIRTPISDQVPILPRSAHWVVLKYSFYVVLG